MRRLGDIRKRMRCKLPEGELGDTRVERFEIDKMGAALSLFSYGGRAPQPGTYTRLMRSGSLWMSDTDAELRDHWGAVSEIADPETRSVLITGLGLGCVVGAALSYDHVGRVDVVELDPEVVELVGPYYAADPRCHIHTDDAFAFMRASTRSWDVIWHDIWRDLSEDNLPAMDELESLGEGRCRWQGFWSRSIVQAEVWKREGRCEDCGAEEQDCVHWADKHCSVCEEEHDWCTCEYDDEYYDDDEDDD